MPEFPGYRTEKQVEQDRARATKAQGADAERSMRQAREWEFTVLFNALPVLREFGRSLAHPAEIPTFRGLSHRLSAGWVVKTVVRYGSEQGNSRTIQSDSETIYALTEEGLYGFGHWVDRGVPAIKFTYAPKPLSVDQMAGVPAHRITGKPGWREMEDNIASLLQPVGIDFRVYRD